MGTKQLGDAFHNRWVKKEPTIWKQCELGGSRLHNTTISTTLILAFLPSSDRMEHSRHEEDASSVGHAASSGWGGMPVVATHTTQQAQEEEGHNEGQQEADNQATQPPGGKRIVLSCGFWL